MMNKYTVILLSVLLSFIIQSCSNHPEVTISDNNIKIDADSVKLEIDIYRDNIIRIVYSRIQDSTDQNSLVVIEEPQKTDWDHSYNGDIMIIKTDNLELNVNIKTLVIKYSNSSGELILAEKTRELAPDLVMNEEVLNVKQSFSLSDDEGIYGLGQHQNRSAYVY